MNRISRKRALRAEALLLLGLAAHVAAAESDERRWQAEISAGIGYHDNFFFRSDSPTISSPSATLTELRASGEREFEAVGADWTLYGSAAATFVTDVDDADSQELKLGAGGKWGGVRATLESTIRPNLLYSEEGLGTFYDLSAIALAGRYVLRNDMWVGAEYELTRWQFASLDADRDADGRALTATYRFPIGERAAVRLIGILANKDARGPENSWDASGLGIALELEPAERWSVFARLRSRDREYRDARTGDSNFDREDTILDVLVNARVRIGERWGLHGEIEYRDGDSTRADRDYDAVVMGLAAYWSL